MNLIISAGLRAIPSTSLLGIALKPNFPIFPKLHKLPGSDFMKITPEIKKFIEANNSLSSRALSSLVLKKFKVDVSYRAIEPHLKAARIETEAANAAKVEAVRSKILDDADKWANKYLQYLDEEVEGLRSLLKTGEQKFTEDKKIEITDIKERVAVSQVLHKHLTTVIEFVKPGDNSEPLNDADLDAKLERLVQRRKDSAH